MLRFEIKQTLQRMINSTRNRQLNPPLPNPKKKAPTDLSLKIIQQFAGAFYVEKKLSILENSFIIN